MEIKDALKDILNHAATTKERNANVFNNRLKDWHERMCSSVQVTNLEKSQIIFPRFKIGVDGWDLFTATLEIFLELWKKNSKTEQTKLKKG